MRLGVVDFLNAFPLYYALERHSELTLVRDVPSRLSERLSRGELDAALISSVEYRRNASRYVFHPGLCIAAEGAVESIRLFTKAGTSLPQVALLKGDFASRSSLVMTRLICGPLSQRPIPQMELVHPPYDSHLENLQTGEALVLIGDPALERRHLPSYDLGAEYRRLTGRGFVYALWVMPERNPSLELLLTEALETALVETEDMQLAAVRRFGFDLEFTRNYLERNIRHILSDELRGDMEWFFQSADKHGLLAPELI